MVKANGHYATDVYSGKGNRKISLTLFIQVFVASLCLVVIWKLQSASIEIRKSKVQHFALRGEILKHLTFGFRLALADLTWLRLIQDIDYKEGKDLKKGWVYQVADAITDLDPRYRMVYITSATILSVGVEDIEGARLIFEKGAANIPDDWSLLYRGGYHYLYEVKDCKRAADFLSRAVANGAPPWVSNLASRLYTRAGQFELALTVVQDAIKRYEGTPVEASFRERYQQLLDAERTGKPLPGGEKEVISNCQEPSAG